MAKARSSGRRQEILETLARMLEEQPGEHITTAGLAKAVGVSEAALYRHFPSKAKMFEALIEFIEESVFSRITRIMEEEPDVAARLQQIIFLILGFADKNPGMTRLMQGDVLVGETARLRVRIAQFFERIETQLRQVLRESELRNALRQPTPETARLLLSVIDGRMALFVRGGFKNSPVEGWERQWEMLSRGIFV
jgi:TetR/AcrR family transcriptional regulator